MNQLIDIKPSARESEQVKGAKAKALPLLLLLLSTLLVITFAGTNGDFPTNDDRLYGTAVRQWIETGRFSIPGSNAFDFIPLHAGRLLCSIVGFSYEWLRFSTILFHLFGITGLYLCFRELNLGRRDSAVISSLYALNPFLINLSLTFMTDVPALALTNWSIYYSIVALRKKHFQSWLIALLATTASMSIRQTSLFVFPALVVAALVSMKDWKDKLLFLAACSIPVISFSLLQNWIIEASAWSNGYSEFSNGMLGAILEFLKDPLGILTTCDKILCYLGLALFPAVVPMSIVLFKRQILNFKEKLSLLFASSTLVAGPLLLTQIKDNSFMPYCFNLFYPPILGCYGLIGGPPVWSYANLKPFSYLCDVLAVACAVPIFAQLYNWVKKNNESALLQRAFFFLLLFASIGLTLLQLKANNLDRYITVLILPVLMLVAPIWKSLSSNGLRRTAIGLTLLLAGYSAISTQDVMNLTRAQYSAIRELEADGISPSQIDGGPAYCLENGGIRFCAIYKPEFKGWDTKVRGGEKTGNLRWWPVQSDEYIIATMKLPNFEVVAEHKYWSTLRFRNRTVYTLHSTDTNDSKTVH